MKPTRRQIAAGLACSLGTGLWRGFAGAGAAFAAPSEPQPPVRGLATEAAAAGLTFGASASKEIFENPAYADLYRAHAKILTTDVALKFDYIRSREDIWDFDEADRLLAFADSNGMKLRGHALIWNENAPDWLERRSSNEIERIFDEHIDRVVGRYAGELHSWDVVNEPFWPGHGKPGDYRTGPWYKALGPAYIPRAFKRAAKADPSARLVLNEAHCERDDLVGRTIRKDMLRLVDELLDAGIPLAAVGLQGHLQPGIRYDDNAFTDFLWRLHERGLNLYITELDVDDRSFSSRERVRDAEVARRYQEFLTAVLKVPSVKLVICWQLADRYSWLRNLALQDNPRTIRLPRPLPFDDQLQPKPAYSSMVGAFRGRKQR